MQMTLAVIGRAPTEEDVFHATARAALESTGATHVWVGALAGDVTRTVATAKQEGADDLPAPGILSAQTGVTTGASPEVRMANGFAVCPIAGSASTRIGAVVVKLGNGAASNPQVPEALLTIATVAALAIEKLRAEQMIERAALHHETLFAGIAHDLRNPLNTFAMSSSLLRDDIEQGDFNPKRATGLVQRMDRAVGRMQRSIEDLLDASRVQGNKITVVPRDEHLPTLMTEAIKQADASARERGASIVAGTIEDARVLVDRARFFQIVARLVAHAARTIGEGGTVRLNAVRNDGQIHFSVRGATASGRLSHDKEEIRSSLAIVLASGLVLAHGGAFEFRIDEGAIVTQFSLAAA